MNTSDNSSPVSLKNSLIIGGLTLACFIFFTWLLRDFVPLNEKQSPTYAWIFGAFTAACITGVFWLAANMFCVVLVDYKKRKKDTNNKDK